MRTLRWSFVLTVLIAACATEASAMPIEPQTLLMLTSKSELIVSAKVEKITLIKHENGFNTKIARLIILSIVKGTKESQTIDVDYSADIICPEPPHYVEGATVLAFLIRNQYGEGYSTVGLSYGAKSLTDGEIEIYSASIRELIEIEKDADPGARQKRLIAWIVRRTEAPATRWEGVYDLRNLRNMDRNVDFAALLTEKQKRRLTATLYSYPPLSVGWMELIELVELWGDENLAPFLWAQLKASTEGSRWGANFLMRKLATLLKNQEALELTEKYEDAIYSSREEEQNAIFQRFIETIERAGAPRPFEIKNEPENPDDPPLQQSAKVRTGLRATLLAFAVLLVVVAAFRYVEASKR